MLWYKGDPEKINLAGALCRPAQQDQHIADNAEFKVIVYNLGNLTMGRRN
jgi:hypothetical protein